MSYAIIKSIVIKNGEVILRASSNNVSPKSFDPWVCPSLTKILNEEGQEALDLEIMREYENGNFQRGDNKWTRALTRLRMMPEYPAFDWRSNEPWEVRDERRKSPEFTTLLRAALYTKTPRDRFILSQLTYGSFGTRVYFWKQAGRYAKFTHEKGKARVFHYYQEAKNFASCYQGGSSWDIISI